MRESVARNKSYITFITLVLGVIFGGFAFILFEFGRISTLQFVSVLRSTLSPSEVRLDLVATFSFIVSLSVFFALAVSRIFLASVHSYLAGLAKRSANLPLSPRVSFAVAIAPNILAVFLIAVSAVSFSFSPETSKAPQERLGDPGLRPHSNVVHIFVESLPTRIHQNSGVIGTESLFLTNSEQWAVGSGVQSLEGHDNTILGLVSAWCASPYPVLEFNDPGSDSYGMKGTRCLHDYYSALDYRLEFVGGYDSRFQAKNIYLQQKGVKILDGTFWESLESQGLDSWNGGLNDEMLFRNLSSVVDSNFLADRKFYLTALTLDTHDADVPPSHCPGEPAVGGVIQFTYSCVGQVVIQFSNWLSNRAKDSGPTLLVVQGDHRPGFHRELENGDGRVFFAAVCLGGSNRMTSEGSPESFLDISEYIVKASKDCALVG